MKKFLAILLATVTLVSLFAVPGFAAQREVVYKADSEITIDGSINDIKNANPQFSLTGVNNVIGMWGDVNYSQNDADAMANPTVAFFNAANCDYMYFAVVVYDNDLCDGDGLTFMMMHNGAWTTLSVDAKTGAYEYNDDGAVGRVATKSEGTVAAVAQIGGGAAYVVEFRIAMLETNRLHTGEDFLFHVTITNHNSDGKKEALTYGNCFDDAKTDLQKIKIDSGKDVADAAPNPGDGTTDSGHNPNGSFGVGKGTEAEPYEISTVAGLKLLAETVNGGDSLAGKYFKLTANIDLTGEEWVSIGGGTAFEGHFNGDGRTISNLSQIAPTNALCGGLFGSIGEAGSVTNVILKNATIECEGGFDNGVGNIGGIASSSKGSITNCTVDNLKIKVGGARFGFAIGGIAAVSSADIEGCLVKNSALEVTSDSAFRLAGICGSLGISIKNCRVENTSLKADSITKAMGEESDNAVGFIGANESSTDKITNCEYVNATLLNQTGKTGNVNGAVNGQVGAIENTGVSTTNPDEVVTNPPVTTDGDGNIGGAQTSDSMMVIGAVALLALAAGVIVSKKKQH